MGEYDRIQKKQVSRVITNRKIKNRRLEGSADANSKSVTQLNTIQLETTIPKLNLSQKKEFTPEEIEAYKKWLMNLYMLFSSSSYSDAFSKIESYKNPKIDIIKQDIEIHEPLSDVNEKIIFFAKKNMFYSQNMRVDIAYPISSTGERFSWVGKYEHLAECILQAVLEEFSHVYQEISNSYLSASTEEYQGGRRGTTKSDGDEIDILAFLMDRGFDVNRLGVIDRYSERKDYYRWRKEQEMLKSIPPAKPITKSFSPTPLRLKEQPVTKTVKEPMPPELIVTPLLKSSQK